MDNLRLIGSDVHYKYTDDDKINVADPTKFVLYRAELLEPGRFGIKSPVAVKKFRIDSSTKEAAQLTNSDLLLRWDNLTKLRHENVVSYHKFAIQWMHPEPDSGRRLIEVDIVMDYCDGSSLYTMIKGMSESKRTLHVKTLFDFSKQMANGIAYLHKNSIIHGSLSADNVLVHQSSTNHFCLRLCAVDNFVSSYATFVVHSVYSSRSIWQAPELMMILREGTCVVRADPWLSALHIVQKMLVSGHPNFPLAKGIHDVQHLMGFIIDEYARYGRMKDRTPETLSPNERLGEYLRCLSAAVGRYRESATEKEIFAMFANYLEKICMSDFAEAQDICATLQKNAGHHFAVLPSDPDLTLDHVMSFYFQRILAPSTTELATETRSFLQSRLLSVPRVDGRKADVWSLGRIMQWMSIFAFDTSQTLKKDDLDSHEDMRAHMTEILGTERMSYWSNYVPQDFNSISDSCSDMFLGTRPTAEQLLNKLVTLEERTYGSTWVYNYQDGVRDEEVSDTHRPMSEVIGCECEYAYDFLRDFVGEGAYGYVHKAEVTRFGSYKGDETVAVKGITLSNTKAKQMQQDQSWEKAQEQWRKLVSLKHPHLVTYHKVTRRKVTTGASIEIMMDYCEGGDLDKLITQCRTGVCSLSLEAVLRYAAQLATGLHYLHANQFIHGDLKPGNVFMDRATGDTGNRLLRIGDLDGAVRISEDSSKPDRLDIAGTGPYMSPEMVMQTLQQEHEEIEFRTDVWSLGCVILDLANCSVGIRERMFYRLLPNVEGMLEIHKIERKSFKSADAFLIKLSQGYHPFVSELIHEDIRSVIRICLMPTYKDRATAAMVLELLRLEW